MKSEKSAILHSEIMEKIKDPDPLRCEHLLNAFMLIVLLITVFLVMKTHFEIDDQLNMFKR